MSHAASSADACKCFSATSSRNGNFYRKQERAHTKSHLQSRVGFGNDDGSHLSRDFVKCFLIVSQMPSDKSKVFELTGCGQHRRAWGLDRLTQAFRLIEVRASRSLHLIVTVSVSVTVTAALSAPLPLPPHTAGLCLSVSVWDSAFIGMPHTPTAASVGRRVSCGPVTCHVPSSACNSGASLCSSCTAHITTYPSLIPKSLNERRAKNETRRCVDRVEETLQ